MSKKKCKTLEREIEKLKKEVSWNRKVLESLCNQFRGIENGMRYVNRLAAAAYDRDKPNIEIINLNGIFLPIDTTVEEAILIFYGLNTFSSIEGYRWKSSLHGQEIVDFKDPVIKYALKVPRRSGGVSYVLSVERTKIDSEEEYG